MLESAITKRIIRLLRDRGHYVLKIHGSAMQPKTIDLLACVNGKFVGLEVKQPGNVATTRQQFTIESIQKASGFAYVVTSAKQVEKLLPLLEGKMSVTTNVEGGVGLPIRTKRAQTAAKALGDIVSKFDADYIYAVAGEIGLDACVTFAKNGESLEFDLTDLQAVALAYALKACNEYRYG